MKAMYFFYVCLAMLLFVVYLTSLISTPHHEPMTYTERQMVRESLVTIYGHHDILNALPKADVTLLEHLDSIESKNRITAIERVRLVHINNMLRTYRAFGEI